MALDVVGFSSIFLNISACISCFILLDRLGEIPYHAARDSNVPLGGKISVPQHRILRIYGIGALWRWVVWHCEFSKQLVTFFKLTNNFLGLLCFIMGACGIFAQLLLYVWLQESKAIKISLTVVVGFSVVPLITFILAPFANLFRGAGSKDQTSDVKSMSSRSDVEGGPRTPVSPLSSIHPFPTTRPSAPGRHSHRSSGAPPFHGKPSPHLGLKEPHAHEGEYRLSFSGNAG